MTVINSYDKPAGEIRKGMYLFGKRVTGVNPRIKKTTVTLDEPVDGKTEWEFRLTDMLEVGVEELTEEELAEKAAEDLAFRKECFVETVKSFVTDAEKKLAKANERQAERQAGGWGLLDHWVLDNLLEAWAHYDLSREVKAVFDSAADGTFHLHAGECDYTWTEGETGGARTCKIPNDYDEYAVSVHIANRMIHRLTAKAMGMRVLSRSTSLTSNLAEDLQMAAVAAFINSLQYSSYGLDEVNLPPRY